MQSFTNWFYAATGQTPYPYQNRLAMADDLPSVLEVPTGGGKTLALVLSYLYRRFGAGPLQKSTTPRRLVYVLPTRALVEQTRAVVHNAIRNLRSTGFLLRDIPVYVLMGGEHEDGWQTRLEAEVVVIGTQDMVLSRMLGRGYALPRTRWPMGAGALASDCLFVWDEVQLMDAGLATSRQLAAAREAFGVFASCHDIWCSATVDPRLLDTHDNPAPRPASPNWWRMEQEDLATESFSRRMQSTRIVHKAPIPAVSADKGAATVLQQYGTSVLAYVQTKVAWRTAADPTLLIMANTVPRAQAVYRAITPWAKAEGLDAILLHSRFRGEEREMLARRLERRNGDRTPRVIVCTQVLEAGVDITSTHLITELAPWASLVQRMGRVNRDGLSPGATVEWIDVGEDAGAPYVPEELDLARVWLEGLEGQSVTPGSLLQNKATEAPLAVRPILRMRDIIELTDTTPELSGADIDVGRYVRGLTETPDVYLFWRSEDPSNEHGAPPPWPERQELCSAPLGGVRDLLGAKGSAFAPDSDGRSWTRVYAGDLTPGGTYWLLSASGGYDVALGFDASVAEAVRPVLLTSVGKNLPHSVEGDRVAERWVTLDAHSQDAVSEMRTLLKGLLPEWGDVASYAHVLELAALLHDRGKAMAVFQAALGDKDGAVTQPADVPSGTIWAKAPTLKRYNPPHFRHEAAGALALLAAPPPALQALPGTLANLVLYLVASHHGRVRFGIRAHPEEVGGSGGRILGLAEGDEVPGVVLAGQTIDFARISLTPIQIGVGPLGLSWVARMHALLVDLGPFRLQALETLLRVADWRASAAEAGMPAAEEGRP